MTDALIRWALRNRAAILLVAVLLTAFGAWRTAAMPVDVFPDLTAPTVTVLTDVHGMAPTEVEVQVTFPIESALNGAAGVRRVRSSTALGISIVWAEFDWGTDPYRARQIVTEKLAVVGEQLPPESGSPVLGPVTSIMGEIMFLALSSEQTDEIALRTFAEQVARRRIMAVPGVAQVVVLGGGVKQYQVRLDPARMAAHEVSLADVADALATANDNTTAGVALRGGRELLVQGIGRLRSVEDVRAVAVRGGLDLPGPEHTGPAHAGVGHPADAPLRVGDLGDVVVGTGLRRGAASANGAPAVILGVQKQPDANTLLLTKQLDDVLDEIERSLPAGVDLDRHVLRQSDFIEVAVDNVAEALRDGALLVVLIMLLFLADLRAAVITLTAIPLSLVVAALVLDALGASINTMTLGGIAIAIGALVDDAVIDVENVFRRLRENAALPEAERRGTLVVVRDASIEIRSSIVFATFIIVLVFVPLFFLSGVEGRLLQPLGVAYVVALLASLVVAVTVTPVLCHLLLPGSRSVRRGGEPFVVRTLRRAYDVVLRPVLRHPWLVVAPTLALLVAAGVAVPRLGRAFLPEFNEGALTISAVTLPGTSLPESDRLGRVIEEIILRQPEVRSVGRRTGRAELDEHAQGVEASELDVAFDLADRSKEEFLAALRADLTLVPGTSITIGQPISHRIDHMLSGTRASVAVKLFGPDLNELRRLAGAVRGAMEGVEGVVDLSVDAQADVPLLQAKVDREALARHGASVQTVAHTLEAAYAGFPVTRLFEGRYAYDLVLGIAEPGTAWDGRAVPGAVTGWDPDALARLPIDVAGGSTRPLSMLAELRPFTGPNRISREAVERKLVVSCNVAGRDLGSVVDGIRSAVEPIVEDAPGYRVEFGGQFESAEEATRTLVLLGLAVVLGVGLLLHLAFDSARDALLVMVNLPLALIGGVAGVFLAGGVLSVASLIGFITVFGIATRNGIMLVSHIRHLQREEGVDDFHEAVRRGASERLAPILMTALATALALVPLVMAADEPGNEIQAPMAVVILCGLTTSMLLNMLVVPTLVLRFARPAPPSTEVDR